jgi:hypothetical protein
MIDRWCLVAVLSALPLASPVSANAQALQDRWPTPADQSRMQGGSPAPAPAPQKAAPAPKPAVKRAPDPGNVIVCGGVFGKDSSHIKLAQTFEAQNIAYTEVDAPDGTKIMASVLYPKDPKRRLEVLWQNDATRSDLSVISINGQSTWTAPKGLKLGIPIAGLEKLNGKPFKLGGFDADGSGSVRDWMEGALSLLPGGCNVGVALVPDPRVPSDIRSQVAADKDFMSNDARVRAARPTVGEINIGYPQ